MRSPCVSGRPKAGEYAPYAAEDIAAVEGIDAIAALERIRNVTVALFEQFGEAGGDVTYAPNKWTVKQVLGHLADDERVFAYRALCVARGDVRELPGFDEVLYAQHAGSETRSMAALLDDYHAVRTASVSLFSGMDAAAWERMGTVNGYRASPRGLAFHIVGHELHHHRLLQERYLPVWHAQVREAPG